MLFTKFDDERLYGEFKNFQSADGDKKEIVLRCIVILAASSTLWFATGISFVLVWGLFYLLLTACYVLYLHQPRSRITPLNLTIVLLASSLVALWFSGCFVYLAYLGWSLPNPSDIASFLMAATFGCIGQALYVLTRNTEYSISALVDFVVCILTGIAIVCFTVSTLNSLALKLIIVVGALCLGTYFVMGFFRIAGERAALAKRYQAELQEQKMSALGRLTGGVAHDFNNLLMVISGSIELAQAEQHPLRLQKHLNNAYEATEQGAELVKQLLAYSRKSTLKASDVDVKQLFEKLYGVLYRLLPSHINLQIEPPPIPLRVNCDPLMLETALLNLVINARDAIVDTGGEIKGDIELATAMDVANSCVQIFVRDNGPGMAVKDMSKALEPFFTTKAVGKGSGLGLSMVKGFVEQSGGSITLANRDPQGLEVAIALPCAPD